MSCPHPVFISVKILGEPIDEVEETPVSVKVISLSSPHSASFHACAPQPNAKESVVPQRLTFQPKAP